MEKREETGEDEKIGRSRRKHSDVNRNDNDYRRSYPGTSSFLNDYAVENYYA